VFLDFSQKSLVQLHHTEHNTFQDGAHHVLLACCGFDANEPSCGLEIADRDL
jgi:hypothetical protein